MKIAENKEGEVSLLVKELKGYYKGSFGVVHAVDGVSLSLRRGEILGLAGESGCGKSTLLMLMTGVINPPLYYEGGEVIVFEKNGERYSIWNMSPEELRKNVSGKLIAYVPQSSFDALNPSLKIKEFMADMLREHTGRKYSPEEVKKMALDHFVRLGLDESVLDRYPHEFSGGMKQRVVIGISTYLRPSILLLDEPTSALDVTSQKRLIELLVHLHRKRIIESMILTSHDLALLRQLCDRIVIMYAGKIVEVGDVESIINKPLHPYTSGLINSLLPLESWVRSRKLTGIGGRPPDLTNPPPGCRFHPRCPRAMDICRSKEPPIIRRGDRLVACWLFYEGE